MKLLRAVLLTIGAALATAIAVGVVALVLSLAFDITVGPRDLKLVSVELVPSASTPLAQPRHAPAPTGLNYRITLKSRADLGDIADDWDMNTYVIDRFDALRNGRILEPGASGPFQDGRRLPLFSSDAEDAERRAAPPMGGHRYEIYIEAVSQGSFRDDVNEDLSYDLLRRPETIRIKLGGGNMAFQSFRTNEVEIPTKALSDAYATYQRNQSR